MHSLTCASRYRAGCTTFSGAQLPKRGQYTPRRPGKRASASRAAEQQSTTELKAPVVPEQYAGASQQAYLAGFKVTVNVNLDSKKGLKAVEFNGGVQQDSLLRSVLKGLVWRVFSTALTVSIILVVFQDTVQLEQALKIGGLEFVLKFLVYFAHERLWVQIGDNIN
ncbi:hypothetical protein WJX82_005886 [Trebouxia sp. C0006]